MAATPAAATAFQHMNALNKTVRTTQHHRNTRGHGLHAAHALVTPRVVHSRILQRQAAHRHSAPFPQAYQGPCIMHAPRHRHCAPCGAAGCWWRRCYQWQRSSWRVCVVCCPAPPRACAAWRHARGHDADAATRPRVPVCGDWRCWWPCPAALAPTHSALAWPRLAGPARPPACKPHARRQGEEEERRRGRRRPVVARVGGRELASRFCLAPI